jgi:hypothetical protein
MTVVCSVNQRERDDHGDGNQCHANRSEDQRRKMRTRALEPAGREGDEERGSEHKRHREQRSNSEQDLPDKVAKCRFASPPPVVPHAALSCHDAVEEHEAHAAADIKEDQPEREYEQHRRGDADEQQPRVVAQQVRRLKVLRLRGIEIRQRDMEGAAGSSHLAGEQADEREPDPLPQSKRLEQLLLCLRESRLNRVDCRRLHGEQH